MHEARSVHCGQRAGDLFAEPRHAAHVEPRIARVDGGIQRHAVDPLHRVSAQRLVGEDLVDRDDVRMPHPRQRAGLEREAPTRALRREQRGREHLQRDVAREAVLPRAVDDAHAAAADFGAERVAIELWRALRDLRLAHRADVARQRHEPQSLGPQMFAAAEQRVDIEAPPALGSIDRLLEDGVEQSLVIGARRRLGHARRVG
jgi:hypothetical protein